MAYEICNLHANVCVSCHNSETRLQCLYYTELYDWRESFHKSQHTYSCVCIIQMHTHMYERLTLHKKHKCQIKSNQMTIQPLTHNNNTTLLFAIVLPIWNWTMWCNNNQLKSLEYTTSIFNYDYNLRVHVNARHIEFTDNNSFIL